MNHCIQQHGTLGKWVEVQIRTRRMDEVAEKDLLHIGNIKEEKETRADKWLKGIREMLKIQPAIPRGHRRFQIKYGDDEIYIYPMAT